MERKNELVYRIFILSYIFNPQIMRHRKIIIKCGPCASGAGKRQSITPVSKEVQMTLYLLLHLKGTIGLTNEWGHRRMVSHQEKKVIRGRIYVEILELNTRTQGLLETDFSRQKELTYEDGPLRTIFLIQDTKVIQNKEKCMDT